MQVQPQTNRREIFSHKLQFPQETIQPENDLLIINNIDYEYEQKNGQQEQKKSQNGLKKKKGRRKKIHKDKPKPKPNKQPQKKEIIPSESIDENSRKLNEDANEQTGRRIIHLNTFADTFEENTIEKFYIELDKNYMSRPSKEHFEIIHKVIELNNLKVTELLNNREKQYEIPVEPYANYLLEVSRNANQISILVTYKNKYLLLYYTIDDQGKTNLSKKKEVNRLLKLVGYIELSEQEYNFLKKRQFFLIQLDHQLKDYKKNILKQSINMSEISKQLLFLNTINKNKHKELIPLLNNIKTTMTKELKEKEFDIDIKIIMDRYMHALLAKNIKKAMEDFEFAILNYFKLFASIQANKQFVPIQNTRELVEYIKKKKVKKTKKTKYPLTTSCLGCLSNFYEQSNPLKNCYQCGTRFHRYCHEITEQICCICQVKRLKRSGAKQCIICPKKGLLYKSVSIGNNIHIFCLLAYNYFQIKNRKVILNIPVLKAENQCDICNLQYGKVEKCKCIGCQKCGTQCFNYAHLLCAYLAGYHVEIRNRGEVYYDCCKYDQNELNKYSFKRKYVSNYQRYAYKYYSEEDFLRQNGGDTNIDIQDKQDRQQRQQREQRQEIQQREQIQREQRLEQREEMQREEKEEIYEEDIQQEEREALQQEEMEEREKKEEKYREKREARQQRQQAQERLQRQQAQEKQQRSQRQQRQVEAQQKQQRIESLQLLERQQKQQEMQVKARQEKQQKQEQQAREEEQNQQNEENEENQKNEQNEQIQQKEKEKNQNGEKKEYKQSERQEKQKIQENIIEQQIDQRFEQRFKGQYIEQTEGKHDMISREQKEHKEYFIIQRQIQQQRDNRIQQQREMEKNLIDLPIVYQDQMEIEYPSNPFRIDQQFQQDFEIPYLESD